MKIFFDTEFIEDGKIIDLISIGMVREDGVTLYLENSECVIWGANKWWVQEYVIPHLTGPQVTKEDMRRQILTFVGSDKPEFWAYYADYDWVVLCQLFGTMMDLPDGWPMYCKDIKQLCDSLGNPELPPQETTEHHALNDALWAFEAWKFLSKYRPEEGLNHERI